jgi:hypothetical protein
LAEEEVILDQKEPFAHTFAGYRVNPFWSSPNVAIIAPGEWVEGSTDHSGEVSEIQRQKKGDPP